MTMHACMPVYWRIFGGPIFVSFRGLSRIANDCPGMSQTPTPEGGREGGRGEEEHYTVNLTPLDFSLLVIYIQLLLSNYCPMVCMQYWCKI